MYPINQWIREGNFYSLNEGKFPRRQVIFKNYSVCLVAIKKIEVSVSFDNSIFITPSMSFRAKLAEVGPLYFGSSFRMSNGLFEIKIDKNSLLQLNEFSKYLRSIAPDVDQQFPEPLKREIETIIRFLTNDPNEQDGSYQHFLPEHPVFSGYVNTNVKNSQIIEMILDLIFKNSYYRNKPEKLALRHEKTIARCQHLLAKGADANQLGETGATALKMIVNTNSLDLAKLFLAYGAVPFYPGEGELVSPIEVAMKGNNIPMIELFTSKLSPLKKSPPAQTITGLSMWPQPHDASMLFRFSDGNSLFCTIKPSHELTEKERAELYALYDSRFGDEPTNDARNELFAAKEGKLITLIYNQDRRIVGTVIYTIKRIDNEIWTVIDLELFHAQHPNLGMMPAITYSVPYSLQLLFPESIVRIVFFSLTNASFNRVKQDLAFPKYQEEGILDKLLIALEHFPYQFKFYSDGQSQFYLIETKPSLIKDSPQPALNDYDEFLYERLRGNNGDLSPEERNRREVLVSMPVAFDFLKTLHRISAHRGINVLQIFYKLAVTLRGTAMLGELFPTANPAQEVLPRFADSTQLFWEKKAVPVPGSAYKAITMAPTADCFQSKL